MESIKLAQKKLTNILREFDKLCRTNNIKYWALNDNRCVVDINICAYIVYSI